MSGPRPTSARTRAVAAFLAIAGGCAALLAATVTLTREPIARHHAAREAAAILELTGLESLPAPGSWIGDAWVGCTEVVLLRGSAAGYGGPIRWLLAANRSATAAPRIRRLLITAHQETPGIADFLNDPEHPWLRGFGGRSTDVATIDAVSGATITTRALTRSVAAALDASPPEPATCAP